ncbi:hypothetical protein IscW_ISCW012006 [Ixodes scapularis]|uniref:Uncharacterized protein n=1 Tax=Ixodes scapularis TaxID=6945 RepID=B7QFU8_IXOSC|nr:hypothetical protein IscW_ISCW012006 [Ixodes scapularis]|eukprot:XP_002400974.1 hypothetical protein IscW_ISCW012006 [Ixodes scapularis]
MERVLPQSGLDALVEDHRLQERAEAALGPEQQELQQHCGNPRAQCIDGLTAEQINRS